MAISTNVKDYSYRSPNPCRNFYQIASTDFAELKPAQPSLAYNAGAGSLAMSTARCGVTWVTAFGESDISTEQTVSISAGSGAFTITQPTVPTNGAAVVGWRVYSSSGGAGTPLLNTAASSTTQTQSTFQTGIGPLLAFPVATTSVQVLIYGTGQGEPTTNTSGRQPALPSISANSSADVQFRVPRVFGVASATKIAIPNEVAETAGVSMTRIDCLAPLWPASTSVALGRQIVVAGMLFECTVAGTTAAANSVPNFAGSTLPVYGTSLGGTVTDNTATWTNRGFWRIASVRYLNATGSGAAPTANQYNVIQD